MKWGNGYAHALQAVRQKGREFGQWISFLNLTPNSSFINYVHNLRWFAWTPWSTDAYSSVGWESVAHVTWVVVKIRQCHQGSAYSKRFMSVSYYYLMCVSTHLFGKTIKFRYVKVLLLFKVLHWVLFFPWVCYTELILWWT